MATTTESVVAISEMPSELRRALVNRVSLKTVL